MASKAWRLSLLLAAIATLPLFAQSAGLQLVQVRHASGQGVAPVYEGFDINPDGSYNLWFGYMNRNYEEALDLPIGSGNWFEPGGDRGQPTHFTPRRHKDVFAVRVPKEFGTQTLTWKLAAHGQTEQVVATLKPVWQIDRQRATRGGNSEKIDSNTPPSVTLRAANQTLAFPASASTTLTVSATDDGLPKRRGQSVGMTVAWSKFRGPGDVAFGAAQARLDNGGAATRASFSEPGDYILQAVVDDGSGEAAGNFGYHCCWHINYVYADDEAPLLPAGTVLHMIGIHDNTSANRRNPDPNMRVGFGERSVDDMLQVWINVVYLDDAEFERLGEARKAKPASTIARQGERR